MGTAGSVIRGGSTTSGGGYSTGGYSTSGGGYSTGGYSTGGGMTGGAGGSVRTVRAYGSGAYAASIGDTPPGARAGECFARTFTPAQYQVRTERVLVQEASSRTEVVKP